MPTTTIAFASWKGGTGKTLLAINTAQQAQEQGLKVRLYDFDPQGSALRYLNQRDKFSEHLPPIAATRADVTDAAAQHIGQQAQSGDYDLLICDMPGADDYAMDRVLDAMDSVIIPISPAPLEILVTAQLIHHGVREGWDMALVPNNLPTAKSRRLHLIETLNGMGVEIAPVGLIRRVTYWDATNYGQGVCEYAPRSPAAGEIRSLWAWLASRSSLPDKSALPTCQEATDG